MSKELDEKIISLIKDKETLEEYRKSKKFKCINNYGWDPYDKSAKSWIRSFTRFGDCIQLLKKCKPKNLEEWVRYYLHSSDQLIKAKKKRGKKDLSKIDEISRECGRSSKELYDFASYFKGFIKAKQGMVITNEEALLIVVIKVIYEPYIGYIREINAIKNLKKELNPVGLTISENAKGVSTSPKTLDHRFATDCMVVEQDTNEPICAIQIKGYSCLTNDNGEVRESVLKNVKKGFDRLKSTWGLDGFIVAADEDGNICAPHIQNLLDYVQAKV